MYLPSAFPISGNYIAVDGSSITTAPIPFALGANFPASPDDVDFYGDKGITIGLPAGGSSSGVLKFYVSEDFIFGSRQGVITTTGNGTTKIGLTIGSSQALTLSAGQNGSVGANILASAGTGTANNNGGAISFNGGSGGTGNSNGGIVQFQGGSGQGTGTSGSVKLLGGTAVSGNRGYTGTWLTGTPGHFTLTSNTTRYSFYTEGNLEVDGTTWLDGALTVAGTTTLATSLTGLLKATAGVVSTAAAGTDYVHTVTASLPIVNVNTAADPQLVFDTSPSFTWTGPHIWESSGSILLREDIPLQIGDNNSAIGDLILRFDSTQGFVGFFDNDSYISNGAKFVFEPGIIVNSGLKQYSRFGVDPQLVTPNDANDTLVVGRSYDGTVANAKRAGFFEVYYTGSTAHSGFSAGLNSFASTTAASSGNLTATTQSGGLTGGRYRTAHGGSGTISLSTGISILNSWTNTGNTTEAIGLQIEAPTISSTGKPGNWYGVKLPAVGSNISSTGMYGLWVGSLKGGYPIWLDTAAEIYFREVGNRIYSSAATTLDFGATTTANITAGTTININAAVSLLPQIAVTTSSITIRDAANFVFNTSTGTKIGTGTTQKIGFYNATPIVQPGATTDLGTVLSNLGLRASGTAYPITTSGAALFQGTFTISKATPTITMTDSGGDDWQIDVTSGVFNIKNTTDTKTLISGSAASDLTLDSVTTTTVNVSGTAVVAFPSGFMAESKAAGNEATGAGTPLFGTNSPAVTNTNPYTWLKFKTSDGSTVYVPAWK